MTHPEEGKNAWRLQDPSRKEGTMSSRDGGKRPKEGNLFQDWSDHDRKGLHHGVPGDMADV